MVREWKVEEGRVRFIELQTTMWSRMPAFGFVSGRSAHADRVATILLSSTNNSVEIDPHTADGLKVAISHPKNRVPDLPGNGVCRKIRNHHRSPGRKPMRPKGYERENLPQRENNCGRRALVKQTIRDTLAAV